MDLITYALLKNSGGGGMPDTYEASRVTIKDQGEHFSSSNVEDVLVEILYDAESFAQRKTIYLKDESAGQSDYAKVYKFYQGDDPADMTKDTFIGSINIPLDKVVQDGHLVTVHDGIDSDGDPVPAGIEDGQYIKLTFQNVEEPIYININDIAQVYTGGSNSEIAVSINNNVISASLVNNGITFGKLDSELQGSINAADSALQPTDVDDLDNQDIIDLFG